MQSERKSIAVLDANAFISMVSLRNLGANTRLITTQDVLGQLRDLKTKEFVDSFPFPIETMNPDDKIVQLVKEFAKKTGDIASLSQIDMELIAITIMLYKKEGLQKQLRKEPPPILEKDDLFQVANKDELSSSQYQDSESEQETQPPAITKQVKQEQKSQSVAIVKQSEQQQKKTKPEVSANEQKQQEDWIVIPAKPKRKVSSSSEQSENEQGWITTKNYEKKMAEVTATFKQQLEEDLSIFHIWLVSADFALQNVSVQMGIKLLSLDGRKISTIRRFIYQCYLCWKKYRIYDEKVKLCNNCGYNSLSKIAYSIDEEGHMFLHRKKGWKPNKKILQVKQRKLEEQERNKKHQHARKKKKASIFQN